MCVCGHHYYDHEDYGGGPLLAPKVHKPDANESDASPSEVRNAVAEESHDDVKSQARSTDSAVLQNGKKKRRRRRWFWPF